MKLPAPYDDRAVVLYDGHCPQCLAWAERLRRCDRGHRLALISLHDPIVPRRFPDVLQKDLMREIHVQDARGRWHRGASALRYLTRRLPRLWWVVPVLHLPLSAPLWRYLYGHVASRRYGCEGEICAVHAPRTRGHDRHRRSKPSESDLNGVQGG